tara:strand:+ start:82 stop:387 length:306 start_codon:yes stop_codon:yes gene_type:complete
MPKYNVDISYTTTVEADDEMEAQEMAVDSHDFGSCSYCVDEEEDKPNIDDVTHAFDEMSTSDLCMWLEDNKEKDNIIERVYWDLDYVEKKWIKEKMEEEDE